ncbi:hypothetical protein [Pandoraea sp. ISTKB]|uniref:hypothetical protein n=1 Tax=Pandoraea sp. ISTKB TaxID=1586708 RepID=UPI000846FD85|nr:hypothetical protein [Pandoraea sp. ISTKB]ODP31918.1 hypothetical protein A9762_24930 [Pandoraea sp. ISTKB]
MPHAFGGWLAGAMALPQVSQIWNGAPAQQALVHELSTTLAQVSAAPIALSTTPASLPSPQPAAASTTKRHDWSRPPITRAQVFAERLTDVRPVCVVGSHDDRENCLLDLPPGVNLDVSAAHLMLAGCEASLPVDVRASLADEGRNAHKLDRAFLKAHVAESHGRYAIPTLERRLIKRLNQISPGMLRLLNSTGAYIEIPQLSFQHTLTSQQEAHRHGIHVPFTDRDLHIPTGEPRAHDAMLGAYIRIPTDGQTYTLLVSLMSALTVELIRQDPRAHVHAQRDRMFGNVPAHLQSTNLKMRRLAHDGNIARALATHLHDGHRRYGEFAYGASREVLAPTSHADVRQRTCAPPSAPSAQVFTTPHDSGPSTPARQDIPASAALPAPRSRRLSRQNKLSVEELAQAIAEIERLDKQYKSQARPRYGR